MFEVSRTIGEKSRRDGSTKSANKPARIRSDACKFGDRFRERFKIRIWCLSRSDSATRERTPPGPSKRARVAIKWIKRVTRLLIAECVAGRELLRKYGRNNNSQMQKDRIHAQHPR